MMIRQPNNTTDKHCFYMNRSMEPATTKTAITVLQEITVKQGKAPEYECITLPGAPHLAVFTCRGSALGVQMNATARSKKEAKQECARLILLELAERGHVVPPPYNMPVSKDTPAASTSASSIVPEKTLGMVPHSYVTLLADLCEQYHLPGSQYELVGDTGPPHMRLFTMRVNIGKHERYATASTKKAARQIAAEQLYKYMRENLARLTKDFVEEEALSRAHERAMDRYVDVKSSESIWRPDLGQRIADYHLGLKTHIDSEKCQLARDILRQLNITASVECAVLEAALAAATAALGLTVTHGALPGEISPLHVIELAPAAPALTFAGTNRRAAVVAALRYLKLAL